MATATPTHHPLLSDPELYDRLYTYARRLVGGDEERARDVVQECYARTMERGPTEMHAGYLYAGVHNLTIDLARTERRRSALLPMLVGGGRRDNPEAEVLDRLALAATLVALSGTVTGEWVVLFALGYHYHEIAERTGTTLTAVRSGICRARQRLAVAS